MTAMTDGVSRLYPHEPTAGGWGDILVFENFLRWVADQGASDIKITPTDPVAIEISGRLVYVTRRRMNESETKTLLDRLARDNSASAKITSGKRCDFGYEIEVEADNRRSGQHRFRGNATGAADRLGVGISITLRLIPKSIPEFDDIGVETALREHLFPDFGLVSIAGTMGSGKTTTLASVIQNIRQNYDKAVMTLEQPMEFDFTTILRSRGTIEQLEVPRMIESFAEGIVSSTRKAIKVLLVGETNDRNTMQSMLHAADIGISVYHTVHTQSVSAIPSRIIHQFTEMEAPGVAVSLLSATRLMIQQRLYPREGGGRVALREWLSLDDSIRRHLIDTPVHKIQPELERMLHKYGRPMIDVAKEAMGNGLISHDVYHKIAAEKESLNHVA